MPNLILGAVMISFSAVFVKLVSVPPTTSAFYRMLFGGLILAGVVLWRREHLRLSSRALVLVVAAAACFALDLSFWHRSILVVGPGVATLLANFQVFVLAAVGVLVLREPLAWWQGLAIPLALAGLTLLVGADWQHLPPDYLRGVAFGLVTACCYAGYLLALRRMRVAADSGSSFATITLISLLTALMLAGEMTVQGEPFRIPNWTDGGWLVAYGVFGQVLGWVLISTGIHRVRASQVGLVLLLQPLCAFVWDALFFQRRFAPLALLGALLALAAIYLGSVRRPPAAGARR